MINILKFPNQDFLAQLKEKEKKEEREEIENGVVLDYLENSLRKHMSHEISKFLLDNAKISYHANICIERLTDKEWEEELKERGDINERT